MKQGDIVIVEFPFSNLAEKKLRPAVVISNAKYNKHKNVILAGIYGKRTPGSIAITNADLISKKLKKASFISLQNIFSIQQSLAGKTIDSLNKKKCDEMLRMLITFVQ